MRWQTPIVCGAGDIGATSAIGLASFRSPPRTMPSRVPHDDLLPPHRDRRLPHSPRLAQTPRAILRDDLRHGAPRDRDAAAAIAAGVVGDRAVGVAARR